MAIHKLTLSIEFEDLDANVAAEVVVRVKASAAQPVARNQYAGPQTFGNPQYGQPYQSMPPASGPQSALNQPPTHQTQSQLGNVQNLIGSLDGPSLQKLLTSMTQNPHLAQTPLANPNGQGPDLSALLQSVQNRPQGTNQPVFNQQPLTNSGYPSYGSPPPQYAQAGGPAGATGMQNNPALSQLLINASSRPPQVAQSQQQQNVQDIMAQLSRYK